MRFQPFELERWLPAHKAKYNLAGALPRPFKFGDLIKEVDLDMTFTYSSLTQGTLELRTEVSNLFTEVDRDRVLITNGTAEANFLLTNVLLDKGEEIIIQVPTYMQVYGIAGAIGAKIKLFYLDEHENYQMNVEKLKELISSKTKVIFITNPNNPTGAKISSDEVRAVCEIAEDRGSYVVCDEALRGLEVDGLMSVSPIDIYEKGICTGSLSKQGFSGLRIGWVVGSKDIIEKCWSYKDYTTLSHSGIGEFFALHIIRQIEKIRERNREILRKNLRILSAWMKRHRQTLSYVEPKAGAAAFPGYKIDVSSIDFCKMLLTKGEVLLSPGDFFNSPKHFRIRYGGHEEQTLVEALDRIGSFLDTLKVQTKSPFNDT